VRGGPRGRGSGQAGSRFTGTPRSARRRAVGNAAPPLPPGRARRSKPSVDGDRNARTTHAKPLPLHRRTSKPGELGRAPVPGPPCIGGPAGALLWALRILEVPRFARPAPIPEHYAHTLLRAHSRWLGARSTRRRGRVGLMGDNGRCDVLAFYVRDRATRKGAAALDNSIAGNVDSSRARDCFGQPNRARCSPALFLTRRRRVKAHWADLSGGARRGLWGPAGSGRTKNFSVCFY